MQQSCLTGHIGSIPAWAGEPYGLITAAVVMGVDPRVGGGTSREERLDPIHLSKNLQEHYLGGCSLFPSNTPSAFTNVLAGNPRVAKP